MVLSADTPTRAIQSAEASTLLLVDDNPVNLQVLLRTLDGRGYRLLVAKDGRTALEIARQAQPDLVLLDVLMPDVGGFEVCRTLKADPKLRNAPVIFLSALGDVSDKVAGLSLGAVDYITKPIQPEEVIARVDVHLTRHRLERELRRTNQRLNRELSGAADMQRLILPRTLPRTEQVQFAAHYQTSKYAGGDYYDVIPLPDGRFGVITLDVSGHGAPSAIVMAMMRTLVHSYPGVPQAPDGMLRYIHKHFEFLTETSVYATAIFAIVDPRRGSMQVSCAGHPLPLRYRPGAGVEALACEATTPLLMRDLGTVPCAEHDLRPGDRVLFYTDGITDRESPSGASYDVSRLSEALARTGAQPAESGLPAIVSDVEAFADGIEAADDNTLLLMGIV
jgi:sigma-B regulation protein RsbU (phosphoserine phosphatase)